MSILGDRFWRGAGGQFAGWGLVDGLIGWLGLRGAHRQSSIPEEHSPARQAKASGNLRRILWINTGLDLAYVTGGIILARTKGREDAFWRGSGFGIAVQGGFLLLFDLLHALLLAEPRSAQLSNHAQCTLEPR
jgi:hypothetical protein